MAKRRFILHDGKHGAALTVRVTPRARKDEVAGIMPDGTLRIRVMAPPIEGKANEALVSFLAKVVGVRKSRIEIVAGEKGLDKIVSVLDMTSGEVEAKVREWIQSRKKPK